MVVTTQHILEHVCNLWRSKCPYELSYLHSANTTYGQRCIKFIGALLWNDLPDHIKNIRSISKFKSKLKLYLQQNYSFILDYCILSSVMYCSAVDKIIAFYCF